MRHIVIGTAGHVDHGKTALVKVLTGIDTDRLAEEKRRGITLELGFAPWRLADDLEAGIVDVPGHESLVRTMVAGATGIDLALLVVAADDGVMPQTREHLDILRLLGVNKGIIVISKIDLGNPESISKVEVDVRDACRNTPFAQVPVVRASSRTGEGLEELETRVLTLAPAVPARPDSGAAYLPLDRVFHKAGFGTVVTGTTARGSIRPGDVLEAFGDTDAAVTELKVRGLQTLGVERPVVGAGMRTAVNLTGREVSVVQRSMILCTPGAFAPVRTILAWVEVLHGARISSDETVLLHLATTEREATVVVLDGQALEADTAGGVLLRLDRPVACYADQRFVLRRPSATGQPTIAGGHILDPEPPHGKGAVRRAAAAVVSLRAGMEDRILALTRESRGRGLTAAAVHRRLPPGDAAAVLEQLEKRGALVRLPGSDPVWVAPETVEKVIERVLALTQKHFAEHPTSAGVSEAELISSVAVPERPLAAVAIEKAVARKALVRAGSLLSLAGRAQAPDAKTLALHDRLLKLIAEAGPMPPFDAELAKIVGLEEKQLQDVLAVLVRGGKLGRVARGLHYDRQVLAEIEKRVEGAVRANGEQSTSALKEVLGSVTRKWAIPLLEYCDQAKITIRVGDVRRLHPTRRK